MITVILPVYNGGAYFKRCIESVAAQDASPGAFDVVVLDSGSTDGCLEALNLLPKHIERRVFGSANRLSIEENWNRIVHLKDVRSFITILGHDDEFDSDFISKATSALNAESATRLLFTHFRLIDQDGNRIRACRPMPARESAGQFLAARLSEIRDSYGTGYVMRFSDYVEVGGIPSYDRLIFADDALWLRFARRQAIRILDVQCFSYRLHPSSTSQLQDSAIVLSAFSKYVDFLLSERDDDGIAWAMNTYALDFTERLARQWLHQELESASLANRLARSDVLSGWRALFSRLACMLGQPGAKIRSNPEVDYAGLVNADPIRRALASTRVGRTVLRFDRRIRTGIHRKIG